MLPSVLLGIIIILLAITLYKIGTRNYDYWKKKGVKYEKPLPFIGNFKKQFLQELSYTKLIGELYNKYPEDRYVGFFEGSRVSLLLRDPDIIKDVLVTKFGQFYNRGFITNESHKDVKEPMLMNLFASEGDVWKLLRQKLTTIFTTAKLRAMVPLMVEKAIRLQNTARQLAEAKLETDVKVLMAKYTTDIIGACAFGIDTESLESNAENFRKVGKRIFTITKRDIIIYTLKLLAPKMFNDLYVFSTYIEKTIFSLMKNVMAQRNYEPSGRNDFIDLFLELRKNKIITGTSIEKKTSDNTPEIAELELSDMLIAAQVFVFFGAGFETSASTSSFTLHQLAFYPEAQKKCQEEIDEVLSRHANKFSYEAIKELKYLELCFHESMRIFPSLGSISRKCMNKYTIPGTNVTIDEGVMIHIPIDALQNDKKYYEDPDTFIPERKRPDKYVYLPFGGGPRACIGERMAFLQAKLGLAAILSQFSVTPSVNSTKKPLVDPQSFVQNVAGGLPLKLVPRKKVL